MTFALARPTEVVVWACGALVAGAIDGTFAGITCYSRMKTIYAKGSGEMREQGWKLCRKMRSCFLLFFFFFQLPMHCKITNCHKGIVWYHCCYLVGSWFQPFCAPGGYRSFCTPNIGHNLHMWCIYTGCHKRDLGKHHILYLGAEGLKGRRNAWFNYSVPTLNSSTIFFYFFIIVIKPCGLLIAAMMCSKWPPLFLQEEHRS